MSFATGIHTSFTAFAGWTWADRMLTAAVEFQDGVDVVCTPGPGNVRRFTVSAPKPEQETFGSRSLGRVTANRRHNVSSRTDTVSNKFKTVRGTKKIAILIESFENSRFFFLAHLGVVH